MLQDLEDLLHFRVPTQFVHAVVRAKEKQRPLISKSFDKPLKSGAGA